MIDNISKYCVLYLNCINCTYGADFICEPSVGINVEELFHLI